MRKHTFDLTEYDPAQPWIMLGTERRSVELADGEDFGNWARAKYPGPRYVVKEVKRREPWALLFQRDSDDQTYDDGLRESS